MWWLVHASCRDIKWLECSVDNLTSWLSRIVVILGLRVRIIHDIIILNLFLALSLQGDDIGCHHGIWVWRNRNTAVIILGLLKQTEKRPFILLQFFQLIQFSLHAIEILIHEIIYMFDLHWLFQLYLLAVSLLHHFLVQSILNQFYFLSFGLHLLIFGRLLILVNFYECLNLLHTTSKLFKEGVLTQSLA